jgi:hypothetical protein
VTIGNNSEKLDSNFKYEFFPHPQAFGNNHVTHVRTDLHQHLCKTSNVILYLITYLLTYLLTHSMVQDII